MAATMKQYIFSLPKRSQIAILNVLLTIVFLGIIAAVLLARYRVLPAIAAEGIIIALAFIMLFFVFCVSRSLAGKTDTLKGDLELASAMQDNLKYGLFLMDEKFNIQEAYSKALEKILAVSSLQAQTFIELLDRSLKKHEIEGFIDYLNMIFKHAFDEQMLDNINPISEFTYYSIEGEEKKYLRTAFKLIRGRKASFILGTVEDITAEKDLEKQLEDAENQVDREMHSLFEVLQLNPRVLSDFIEDTEYEFEAINEVLKRQEQISKKVMYEVYQSVHAVKSNAVILNLENFSAKLHDLESSIKLIQEKNEDVVPFDEILGLVLEIDEALKEKDEHKKAITKIENFRKMYSESSNQEIYVLVETLTQVCKKTMLALNKKVKLVVEGIDEVVLDYGPRRVIKEVLTQLVRNSVYHGIEEPSERESLGKNPEGEIMFSIRYRDNRIVIKFTDDGRGIDFSKIKQKAADNNLLGNPDDKNQLLEVIFLPGFSTLESPDLYSGRGVGLSLVKDRIKNLLGNITVSTVAGRGTTFTLSLPMQLPVFTENGREEITS